MMEGRDADGTQVYPGNFTIVHAQVTPKQIDPIFADLQRFRQGKTSRQRRLDVSAAYAALGGGARFERARMGAFAQVEIALVKLG